MTNPPIQLPRFTRETAESEIRRIAKEDTGNLILLDHALDRMEQREISLRQILNVLKNGEAVLPSSWDTEKEKGWKCKFRRVTAGTDVTVVAKLVERNESTCLIVTVF